MIFKSKSDKIIQSLQETNEDLYKIIEQHKNTIQSLNQTLETYKTLFLEQERTILNYQETIKLLTQSTTPMQNFAHIGFKIN